MALEVTTGDANDITPTSATLNGTVDDFGDVEEELDVWFKYGTDYDSDNDEITDASETSKETLVISEESTPVDISHDIDELDADTEYHFRIVAEGA